MKPRFYSHGAEVFARSLIIKNLIRSQTIKPTVCLIPPTFVPHQDCMRVGTAGGSLVMKSHDTEKKSVTIFRLMGDLVKEETPVSCGDRTCLFSTLTYVISTILKHIAEAASNHITTYTW